MRNNRQLRNIIGLSLIPIAIIVLVFSCWQITYKDIAVYAILNNVFICILTGGIVAFFEAIIGYENAKHECILAFYRDLMMIEYKIGHFPYNRVGFVDALSGLNDVRDVISTFSSGAKYSYTQIDFPKNGNKVFTAVKTLYSTYGKHIKAFREFDDELCAALRFLDASKDELIENGITDIPSECKKVNRRLQAKAEEIRDLYNSEEDRKTRDEAFTVLEQYLFKLKAIKL